MLKFADALRHRFFSQIRNNVLRLFSVWINRHKSRNPTSCGILSFIVITSSTLWRYNILCLCSPVAETPLRIFISHHFPLIFSSPIIITWISHSSSSLGNAHHSSRTCLYSFSPWMHLVVPEKRKEKQEQLNTWYDDKKIN